MKRRLNILCAIVFLILGYSLFTTGYQFGTGVKAGLDLGEKIKTEMKMSTNERVKQKLAMVGNYQLVDLVPIGAMWEPDSIYNLKTEERVPMMYHRVAVMVDKDLDVSYIVVNSIASLLGIAALVASVIVFLLLILSINKSQIFEWKNVRRLRWMGGLLISVFVCYAVPELMSYWNISAVFEPENYMLDPFSLQMSDLLLGIGCLIVAETFAIGMKMKEEQELTI